MAIRNDPYGLQPLKVAEPAPGIQIWAKPMAVAGKRAIAILNRTDTPAKVKVDWEKVGFEGTPTSLRDVWNHQDLTTVDAASTIPAGDLVLLVAGGADKKPAEYLAKQLEITGIQAMRGPAFALLQYANTSGQVVLVKVKSTSGLSTAFALTPTAGPNTGTVGLILPHGTADLSFEAQGAAIRKLAVYNWEH